MGHTRVSETHVHIQRHFNLQMKQHYAIHLWAPCQNKVKQVVHAPINVGEQVTKRNEGKVFIVSDS